MPSDVAHHIVQFYGTLCEKVIASGDRSKLHPDYPFMKSEIQYAIDNEMAVKPNDIICRRIPLAFLNEKVALDLLPIVVEQMASHFNWSSERSMAELNDAIENLQYQK